MVLITRYLPSVIDGNVPNIEGVTSKDAIVDAVLQNTTVGIINQLMVLAGHANSVFTSLTQESAAITQRLNRIGQRLEPLVQMVPSIESFHQKSTIDTLNSRPRAEFHADNPEKHQMFMSTSVPPNVKQIYDEKCQPPPKLHLLDPYMDNGQKSLKLYTNPDFFIDEWVAEQTKLREEARQRRRERKEARLKKKNEKTTETSEVKVKRVHKVRYDPVTGEKILIPFDGPAGSGSPATQHPSNVSMQPTNANLPPPPSNYPTNNNYMPPPPPTGNFPPPPPLSASSGSAFLPSPPPIGGQQSGGIPPRPISSGAGSFMGQPGARQSVIQQSAPAPPPPPAPAPPPPPPPMAKGGFNASSLEGASLRQTEIKPKAADARSDLLSSIVNGMTLKPAEERKIPEPTVKQSDPINVADILARRIAWAHSDSEDDDSDDDSDWD